jgi:hypothetical protein
MTMVRILRPYILAISGPWPSLFAHMPRSSFVCNFTRMCESAAYRVVLSVAPKERGQWALPGTEQSSNQQPTAQELAALRRDPLPTTLQLRSPEISVRPSPLSRELSPGSSTVASPNSNALHRQAIHRNLRTNSLTPSPLQPATSTPSETGRESGYDVNSAIQTDTSDDTLLPTVRIEEDQQPSDGNEGSNGGAGDAGDEDQPMSNGDEGSDVRRAEDAGHEGQPPSDENEGSNVRRAEDAGHEGQPPSDENEGSNVRRAEDEGHEGQPPSDENVGSDVVRAKDAGHEGQPPSDGNEGSDVLPAEDAGHEDQPPLDGNKGSNVERAEDAGNVGEANTAAGASKPATADHQDMPDEGPEEEASNDRGKKKTPAAKRITRAANRKAAIPHESKEHNASEPSTSGNSACLLA